MKDDVKTFHISRPFKGVFFVTEVYTQKLTFFLFIGYVLIMLCENLLNLASHSRTFTCLVTIAT